MAFPSIDDRVIVYHIAYFTRRSESSFTTNKKSHRDQHMSGSKSPFQKGCRV